MTNGNLDAHFGALFFLAGIAMVVALAASSVLLFFSRRPWARYPLWGIAAILAGYGVLMAIFSVVSYDRTLARGQEKYFCELDCHIAYSVQNVQRMKSIGDLNAQGEFYVVTVRSRFDENTIAPWRGRERPLIPNGPTPTIVDSQGHKYSISSAGQSAWEAAHGPTHSMLECLRPGESYETTRVFDVPAEAESLRLLLTASDVPSRALIGDEDSPGHGKTYLAL